MKFQIHLGCFLEYFLLQLITNRLKNVEEVWNITLVRMGIKTKISCYLKKIQKLFNIQFQFKVPDFSGPFCGTKKSHACLGICALDICLHMFIIYAREISVYACIWTYKYLYAFN